MEIGDLRHRITLQKPVSYTHLFVVHTIRPWLVRLEQAFNNALFSKAEKGEFFASFVVDGLLRGDYESRMKGYAIGIQNGFMSPNDVRSLENMNPIPEAEGGDTYMVNGNMLKLKDVGAYIKEKAGGEEDKKILELD